MVLLVVDAPLRVGDATCGLTESAGESGCTRDDSAAFVSGMERSVPKRGAIVVSMIVGVVATGRGDCDGSVFVAICAVVGIVCLAMPTDMMALP